MITPYSNTISVTTLPDTGLLVDYPGAAAAYSLRQLTTAYTGDAIRVRRSSDNLETDIGFDSNGELDETALLAHVGTGGTDNGFVTTWYDQSGNGYDATQSTAASQPKIVSSGSVIEENGKPTLSFDGNDDILSNTTLTPSSTQSVFYVKKGANLVGNSSLLGFPTEGGNTQLGMYYWNASPYQYGFNTWSGDTWGFNNGDTLFLSQTLEMALFLDGNPTTSGVKLFINDSQKTLSQVKGTSASRTMQTGFHIADGASSAGNQVFDGYFQEIVIWSDDYSSTNRSGIQTNINAQYQIYWDGSQTSLLDSYGGSAAAYSLRALSSSYTGALIRVRRASDNAEQDIYAKYDGSLNTDALESFCSGTDGFIETWYDQSGSGNNATQTTTSSQPQIVSGGSVITENGKPAVQFDGSGDYFNLTSSIATNVDYTGFQVLKRNATSTISITMAGTTTNDSYLSWNYNDNNIYFRGSRGYITTSLDIVGQSLFTSLNIHTGNMTIYNNGSSVVSSSPTTLSGTSVMNAIGRRGTDYGIGTTQEIIVYSSDQSSNQSGIETNINDFYTIY